MVIKENFTIIGSTITPKMSKKLPSGVQKKNRVYSKIAEKSTKITLKSSVFTRKLLARKCQARARREKGNVQLIDICHKCT